MTAALGEETRDAEPTVADRLGQAVAALTRAGVEAPRRDAEWLLAGLIGVPRFAVYAASRSVMSAALAQAFASAVRRRAGGEPLQQILGWEGFHGLRLGVTPDVLIPRPETEVLVEWALACIPAGPRCVIDVGTGSGCIAAALAVERPDVAVCAIDVSASAARVARANVRALGLQNRVRVVVADLLDAVGDARADVVVANPPYLPEAMVGTLSREVRDFEPRIALSGGSEGTDVIDRLVRDARRALAPGGALLLETAGDFQIDGVVQLFERSGYRTVETRRDLTGQRRFVAGRRDAAA